jgi:hypothetical protein
LADVKPSFYVSLNKDELCHLCTETFASFKKKTNLVSVVLSMSLVNEDGDTSKGVMMQIDGNVERFSGDENFEVKDAALNSSGAVRKIGTCNIKSLAKPFLSKHLFFN